MIIQLGNLNLEDVVSEEHLPTIKKFLDENGYRKESVCDKINDTVGNYHIFDIPRLFMICGEQEMHDFLTFLKDNDLIANGFKERMGLTFQEPAQHLLTPNEQ